MYKSNPCNQWNSDLLFHFVNETDIIVRNEMQMVQDVVEMQIQAAKFLFTISIMRPASIMRFFFLESDRSYFSSFTDVFLLSLSPFPLNIPLFHLSISLTVIF